MNLLNKLTIKNLILNKKRTIVTIMGIILSVALITAVASMYASGINSLINFEKSNYGNYHVAFYDVPEANLATFDNNIGIDEIYLTKNIGYAKINTKNEDKPYAYIKAYTKSSLNNLAVNLTSGRMPTNDKEIIIPTHLKTNGRLTLNIGDTLTLNVGERISADGTILHQNNPFQNYIVDEKTGETIPNQIAENIINTTTKTYKIVGIMERPSSSIESYSAPGYTFITYLDTTTKSNYDVFVKLNKKGLKKAYNITANILGVDENLFTKINKGDANLTAEDYDKYSEMMAKSKYKLNLNSYLIGLETNPIASSSIGGLGIAVVIVILIIIFTSIFCIKNSFDISITEKIKQYGMLKSIGATKKQIKKNVFYEATILGLIGIPLGIIAGFLTSYILVIITDYFLKDFLNGPFLTFSFSYLALLISTILGIITIYSSAFRSAKRASHVTPIASIKNSNNLKINSKKLKTPPLIKKIFGIGGDISYKNLKRNKKKYRTTVISLVVSVFVFIALSSFMNLAFLSVDETFKMSDYNLFLTIRNKSIDSKKLEEATSLDNIEDYSNLKTSSITFENSKYSKEYLDWENLDYNSNYDGYLEVIALGDYQYKKYLQTLGLKYNDLKDKAILFDYIKVSKYEEKNNKIKSKYMHVYDYQKDDIIKSSPTMNIGYVTDIKPFGLKTSEASFIIVSDEYFEKNMSLNSLNIIYKSNNASKLQDELDEILKGEDYDLQNIEENVRMMNSLYTLIGIFLYGFIIVVSLIGVTNIFNTITTNMELRRKEFAMLKSVGMTKKEFKRMIRLESVFMGLKALMLGIPIGIALSYLIYYSLGKGLGVAYKLPIMAILISVLAVFILISLIMRYSVNKTNKQNTIETIRNENI